MQDARAPRSRNEPLHAPFSCTTYQRFGANLLWITCGHDTTSSGCCGSGDLGPFGRPCAIAGDGQNAVVADRIDLGTGSATAGSTCGGNTSAITVSDKAVVVSQTRCFSAFDLTGVMQEDGGQASNTVETGVRGDSS